MPILKLLPTRLTYTLSPVIELLFFGERHNFIVDTGASNTVISYKLFNKFPLQEHHYNNIEIGKIFGSAGSRFSMRVPFKIRILGKVANEVSVGHFLDGWRADQNFVFSGLLGQDVMTQFKRVLIDNEKGEISFL